MNLFFHCFLILFNLVYFINTFDYYRYAKKKIDLHCPNSAQWFINKPNSPFFERIEENDRNYTIIKNKSLTILYPINNATYKAKPKSTNVSLNCETTTKLYGRYFSLFPSSKFT